VMVSADAALAVIAIFANEALVPVLVKPNG
jgi:hypothetical protein